MSLAGRPGQFGSRFHNRLYERLGLDYVYKAFTTDDLPAAIGGIRALAIRGCAISMPFKEAVIPMLDGLEPSAAAIGSVNTIVNDDGRLSGHNTDYTAVVLLLDRAEFNRAGLDRAAPFLLRGAGGMAKSVAAALRDLGHRRGTVVARNEARGRALAGLYGFEWAPAPDGREAALLINATPLGMDGPDVNAMAFGERAVAVADLVFDVVASPAEIPLLRAAGRLGRPSIAGVEVAALQALEQFVLYTGIRPDASAVQDAASYARQAARGPELAC